MTHADLPPDRSGVATEQRHGDSIDFDQLETHAAVDLLARDHARVIDAVRAAGPDLAAFIDALVPRLRRGGRLIYVGAGTSGRLGVLDAAECPPTFHADPEQIVGIIAGGDAALRRSSEGLEDDPDGAAPALDAIGLAEEDTLLAIAAGGTTPYAIGAIRVARRVSAATGFLTCSPAAASIDCDHLIVLDTGPEILTGSTRLKAGTATKLALNTITTVAFTRLGKVYGHLMVDLRATNDKLVDRALRILHTFEPNLDRADTHAALVAADMHLKTAIVMQRLGVDRQDAERRLADADGGLRAVLEGDV